MSNQFNTEHVNDTAKLMIHRLIAREIGRDPSLIERAKDTYARNSQHLGHSFVQDWNDILDRPANEVRHLLTSRDENMMRLRLSSPFVLTDGIDFTDVNLRRRIWRAARHVAYRAQSRTRIAA